MAKVVLEFDKETKSTYRYQVEGDEGIGGVIYIKKKDLDKKYDKPPKELTGNIDFPAPSSKKQKRKRKDDEEEEDG